MAAGNKFVFAIHRGGSSVIGDLVNACAKAGGEKVVMIGAGNQVFQETGPDGAAMRRAAPPAPEAYIPNVLNWGVRSGAFAPIRRADFFPSEIFRPGVDLALLNIRDPRDCMVSGYFGFLRLHGQGLKDPSRRRQYEMGIDAYVVDKMLDRYISVCRDFMVLGSKINTLHVLTYEEMVTDFPTWFRKFYTLLEFKEEKFSSLLVQQAERFRPPVKEDIDRHKRQMLPGDYLRKLQPATISHINSRMAAELKFFGYL